MVIKGGDLRMLNFGRKIVKFRIPILILSLLLLIPSLFGYM